MKFVIQLSLLLAVYYKQVSGQFFPQGCCTTPLYQSPAACCPLPCCVATAAPVLCCQTQEVMKLRLTLKSTLTWDNDYGDSKSAKFKALAKKFEDALKKVYAKTPSFSDARVSQFAKGSTVSTFVLAFKMADPDPLKPLRDAIASKYIPDEKDAGKLQIDANSLTLSDKVIPLNVKVNLDTKASPKQESDSEMKMSILNNINEKRKVHGANKLALSSKLVLSSLAWAKELGKTKKLKYSPQEAKQQSEIAVLTCKKPGEILTGKEVVDKWYAEAKTFFDPKTPLKTKAVNAKRFMQAMWKSSTGAGVGVYRYKEGTSTCFIVVTFLTPKATQLTSSTVVNKNVLKGSYKGNKDELKQDGIYPADDQAEIPNENVDATTIPTEPDDVVEDSDVDVDDPDVDDDEDWDTEDETLPWEQ